MIFNYSDFLIEREFQELVGEMELLIESEGRWVSDRSYEWDLSGDKSNPDLDFVDRLIQKTKEFVKNLPKEKIKGYFIKLVNRLEKIPDALRKKIMVGYLGVFLALVNIGYLTSSSNNDSINPIIKKEIEELYKEEFESEKIIIKAPNRSSFSEAQKLVKIAEAGYSDDRSDTGNWISIPGIGKRFIGTNHGISAPVLKDWLGRDPKKEDMMNLSYEDALKIYKKNYWSAQNLSYFSNQSVANIIYDGCVNQGVSAMNGILQEIYKMNGINTNADSFSKESIKFANELDQEALFNSIKKLRGEKYKEARTWRIHGRGWMNRLNSIEYSEDSQRTNVA